MKRENKLGVKSRQHKRTKQRRDNAFTIIETKKSHDNKVWVMPSFEDFKPNEARKVDESGVFLSRQGDEKDLFWSASDPRKKIGRHKGRYPLLLSVRRMKKLLRLMLTDEEFCSVMEPPLSVETLARLRESPNFAEFFEGCKSRAKCSLRRMQWVAARGTKSIIITTQITDSKGQTTVTEKQINGNPPSVRMLIHLGRVYLKQQKVVESDLDINSIHALRALQEQSRLRDRVLNDDPELSGRRR
jgi:hypothetical protein